MGMSTYRGEQLRVFQSGLLQSREPRHVYPVEWLTWRWLHLNNTLDHRLFMQNGHSEIMSLIDFMVNNADNADNMLESPYHLTSQSNQNESLAM